MTFEQLVEKVLEGNTLPENTQPIFLTIFESFELKHNNNNELKYEIVTRSNTTYEVNLKIYTKEELLSITKVRKLGAESKKNLTVSTGYEELNKILENKKGLSIFIEFNRNGEHKITNDTATSAYEVFLTLRYCVLDALQRYNTYETDCFIFRTNKQEHEKRFSLYSKMIKKALDNKLPNTFIDTISEPGNNIVYYY